MLTIDIKIKPYGVVYLLRNKINDKIYIGRTTNFRKRISKHRNSWKEANYPIARAIEEYGFENFEYEILEYCFSEIELSEKEINYIKEYDSLDYNKGYNSNLDKRRIFNNDVRKRCLNLIRV